jgi:sulfate-transporting ATPase
MSVCDEIVVLDFGRRIAQGAPDVIRRDELVVAAYLGEEEPQLDRASVASGSSEAQA